MADNKLLLKICINEWHNASRDKRELGVVSSLDFDIKVMVKGDFNTKNESVDGFSVDRYTTRPLGNRAPNALNKVLSFFGWCKYARRYDADVISGHDFVALLIGRLSNIFKHKKAKLVYDSHEFEIGRNANRSAFSKKMVSLLERWAIHSSQFTIVVNDSIADAVQNEYSLSDRPVVVRNIPPYIELKKNEVLERRKEIADGFGKKVEKILMYHGGITSNRGLEYLIEIVSENPKWGLFILGDFDNNAYREKLCGNIKRWEVSDRVTIHSAVKFGELISYVAASDCGMIIVPPTCKSYYYMLPNKLFENIQACTPVITSNFPEISGIVTKYDIGMVTDAEDKCKIYETINELFSDSDRYKRFQKNLNVAKQELCWEKEKKILYRAYSSIKEELNER